jgi:hypothetical protein
MDLNIFTLLVFNKKNVFILYDNEKSKIQVKINKLSLSVCI